MHRYVSRGYIHADEDEDVSLTLNYALSDWAVAQAAASLGKTIPQAPLY